MNSATSAPAAAGKKKAATPDLLKHVGKLFDLAIKGAQPSELEEMSQDKLFEMLVLARVLRRFRQAHSLNRVVHVPATKGGKPAEVVVAGKPSLPDRSDWSHFDLVNQHGVVEAEVWTSIEFAPLSWLLKNGPGSGGAAPRQARHELDVCVLKPDVPPRPDASHVMAWFSCKDVRSFAKESVREALGFRRETAYLDAPAGSLTPWLMPNVPADPPSPGFLACSDLGVRNYAASVDAMGVYVRYVRRPW